MPRYRYLAMAILLWLCAGFALFATCASCSRFAHPEFATAGVERAVTASARIRILCNGALRGYGTGVALSPRYMVTARHVVRACDTTPTPDMAQYFAVFDDGRTYEVALEREASKKRVDAALLVKVGGGEFPSWAAVAYHRPARGDRVWLYTGDGTLDQEGEWAFQLKEGRVSHVTDEYIVVSGHGVPGNSGAGVFDEEGRVIGILWGGAWDSSEEFYFEAFRPAAWADLMPPAELDWTP